MRPIIVGTAGHVDHGKTALIKALTGVNTDRLREEQERGISIELGFAPFHLPDGRLAGVVDVPGHERFIRNMLAGVPGMDMVLLVVAADEGVMPQTLEHLDILTLLQVRRGIVVITKADLVDADWLELVKEDIRRELRGSALEGAPMVAVSSVTGQGLPELVRLIGQVAQEAGLAPRPPMLRLPIDRVFALEGHGTIVTGTLVGGQVSPGQAVEVLPAGIQTRVRSVQVHGAPVESAQAGQRTALNLAGVGTQEIQRGHVVVEPNTLTATTRLDVRVRVLPRSPRPLVDRMRIRLYVGTAEAIGRIQLLDQDSLPPGAAGFGQITLEAPVVAVRGDLFVLRNFSPLETLGGGQVLDGQPPRHRRHQPEDLAELAALEQGEPGQVVEVMLRRCRRRPCRLQDLWRSTLLPRPVLEEVLRRLGSTGSPAAAVALGGGLFVHGRHYQQLQEQVTAALEDAHKKSPLTGGLNREELRSKVAPQWEPAEFVRLLDDLSRCGRVALDGSWVRLAGHRAELSPELAQAARRLQESLQAAGANPPPFEVLCGQAGLPAPAVRRLLDFLAQEGHVVRLAENVYFDAAVIPRARAAVRQMLAEAGQVETAAFRDRLGTSRKFAILLLELFDQEHFTRRVGDVRLPGARFTANP